MNNNRIMKLRLVQIVLTWLAAACLCISSASFAAAQPPATPQVKAKPARSKAARRGAAGDEARPSGPAPTVTNITYGPDASNKIDFWKANSAAPAPVVVFIHGGRFRAGDKS